MHYLTHMSSGDTVWRHKTLSTLVEVMFLPNIWSQAINWTNTESWQMGESEIIFSAMRIRVDTFCLSGKYLYKCSLSCSLFCVSINKGVCLSQKVMGFWRNVCVISHSRLICILDIKDRRISPNSRDFYQQVLFLAVIYLLHEYSDF